MQFNDLYNSRRVVLIFSHPDSASLAVVKREIEQNRREIEERDLDVYLLTHSQIIGLTPLTEEANAISEISIRALHSGAAFELVLIGKDGDVKSRSERPDDLPYFLNLIDSMPMRQAEIKRQKSGK